MRRIILSLLITGLIGVVVLRFSGAFFSDTEKSSNNVLVAGSIDIKIDNTSYLNHATSSATTWQFSDLNDGQGPSSGQYLFFNFTDIKPDDEGEDTISLHVEGNEAWACMNMSITKNDDNTCTEPESLDDTTCNEPDDDTLDGELAQNLNFIFWNDDGDNILETEENVLAEGSASAVLNDTTIILADSSENNLAVQPVGPLSGNGTYYIGKAWCFGILTKAPLTQDSLGVESPYSPANTTGGISCDGTSLDNSTQSDVLMGDISFSAYQARNNPDFLCVPGEPTPTPSPSPTPTPLACEQADVMLVLDRSGSINSTELTQLKTAAKAFVDALGLSTLGIHGGMSSFATTGTLNHHLSDDSATLKASIDALVSTGFTNLKAGIDLASAELVFPGDGHDRVDGSSPDKMIIITDGNPNRPFPSSTADDVALASANAAKVGGTEIFVVGVGSDVDDTYLETVATDPAHYYSVADGYGGLETILAGIDLCD